MFRFVTAAICVAALPGISLAQSVLGVTGLDLEAGLASGEAGGNGAEARLDVAITDYHGLQLDLGLRNMTYARIGSASAHLYMTPRAGQKYGLFLAVFDEDDRANTYGTIGAEGRLRLSPASIVEGRAGAGLAQEGQLDYVFLGAGFWTQVSQRAAFFSEGELVDYDEATLQATGYVARVGSHYRVTNNVMLTVAVEVVGRQGADAADPQTGGFLGLTWRIGGSPDPVMAPFRTVDPLRPLWNVKRN